MWRAKPYVLSHIREILMVAAASCGGGLGNRNLQVWQAKGLGVKLTDSTGQESARRLQNMLQTAQGFTGGERNPMC